MLSLKLVKSLRNVDHEITHLLKLRHDVHIIDTGLPVLAAVLHIVDLLVTQIVAVSVDA